MANMVARTIYDRQSFKGAGPEDWVGDLTPLASQDWSYDRAAHLLERAAFGGTPDAISHLAGLTPSQAVDHLVDYQSIPDDLPAFHPSGVWDPTLKNFPPSRVAATKLAQAKGEAMGVRIKPKGERPLQPVVDRFFYWLRATLLETRRLGHWWADRMVRSQRPLEEKLTLFWHGHFATGEDKIRDYRKMEQQIVFLRQQANGNFRTLLTGIAQDPAMLVFLDAAQNVKGAPNENFAREVTELFTMGPGHYSEQDIREAARAFTGWIDDDLAFKVDLEKHDGSDKIFLGQKGAFDGLDILRIILDQEVTAEFIAAKIYRYFVAEEPSEALIKQLAAIFRTADYDIKPLLKVIFLSRDFYSPKAFATRIKGPVEMIVTLYRQLGVQSLPGVPDFNAVCRDLGQVLLNPPTVAGWPQGRAWMNPGAMFARNNLARDILFPNLIEFTDPNFDPGDEIKRVNSKIRAGLSIGAATIEQTAAANMDGQAMGGGAMSGATMGNMTMANEIASAEEFNTRYGSLMGWQEAVRRVLPLERSPARFDLTRSVLAQEASTVSDAVDLLLLRFLHVPLAGQAREALITYLEAQLGTPSLSQASTYMEEPLRRVAHMIMSMPEYQLG